MSDQFIHIFAQIRGIPGAWKLLFADLSTQCVKRDFLKHYRSNGTILTIENAIIPITDLSAVRIIKTNRTLRDEIDQMEKQLEWESSMFRSSNSVVRGPIKLEPHDLIDEERFEKEDLTSRFISTGPGPHGFFAHLRVWGFKALENFIVKAFVGILVGLLIVWLGLKQLAV